MSNEVKEARLDAIRQEAARAGKVSAAGVRAAGAPIPQTGERSGYYGLPLLKQPVWTWEIPLYFFVGGVAGVSAVTAFFADMIGSHLSLVRAALWLAVIGGVISPVLLISDLGRPKRFLAMLRVFKWQSPMSIGVWTLAGFTPAVVVAAVVFEFIQTGNHIPFLLILKFLSEGVACLFGAILVTYTGVLLGATVIPVWSENRKLLPPHFAASALGSAAAILELLGFLIPATYILGLVAAAVETLVGILIEIRKREVDRPLRQGKTGRTIRAGGMLSGPVSLAVRIVWGYSSVGRLIAASSFIVGALITRYAWLWAGRVSASDPTYLFQLQRK